MSSARTDATAGGRWLGLYVLAYLVFLYLPILLIPLFSFNDSIQAAFPLQGFTLGWYETLYGNPALSGALANSLVIAVIAASGATLCGITVSYMDLYGRSPLAATISAVARLPILIPGVIVGISLLILVNLIGVFSQEEAIKGIDWNTIGLLTGMMILISVSRRSGMFQYIAVWSAQAAKAHPAKMLLLLQIATAVLSAFMLAFLTSFDEFIVVFFLAGTEPTLPLYIWSQLRFPRSLPTVMALGTVILTVSFIIAALAEILRHRGLGTARRAAIPA